MRHLRAAARMTAFFAVLLTVQFYIGWNSYVLLSVWTDSVPSALFWVIYAVISMSYLLSASVGRFLPWAAVRLLKLIGSYWFFVLQYGLLLLPFADLAVWLMIQSSVPREQAIEWAGSAVLVVLLALFARGSWNAWSPVIRSYSVSVPKKAGALTSLRIAAASDIHLGSMVGRRYLRKLVKVVNAMKPDIVLLPGDVLDDSIEPFKRFGLDRIISGFRSRYGTFAVLGNHEHYGRNIEEFIGLMDKAGIPVLTDESIKIDDSFYIIGRKDKTSDAAEGRKPIRELVAPLDRSLPLIMLDHQPSALREAAEVGIDVSLSGHTHRGQLAPIHWITRKLFELDWGYKQIGRLHAIVSSGYGTWGPPVRLASRSEILDVTVHFNG